METPKENKDYLPYPNVALTLGENNIIISDHVCPKNGI